MRSGAIVIDGEGRVEQEGQRVKQLRVSFHLLEAIVKADREALAPWIDKLRETESTAPDDLKIVTAKCDPEDMYAGRLVLYVESETFPVVEPGHLIPEVDVFITWSKKISENREG